MIYLWFIVPCLVYLALGFWAAWKTANEPNTDQGHDK